ncbi:MAG: PadR family transcriptional regulator [Mobilitalea sp.]
MVEAQLLKGILEGCILSIISRGETYGYDILSVLEKQGFTDVLEGTLYPVLARLESKENIICRIGKSPFGPKRKYYSITEKGKGKLEQFIASYNNIINLTNSILLDTDRGSER